MRDWFYLFYCLLTTDVYDVDHNGGNYNFFVIRFTGNLSNSSGTTYLNTLSDSLGLLDQIQLTKTSTIKFLSTETYPQVNNLLSLY